MPLSTRYYLADAVFVAAVEGDSELLETLNQAVQHPRFPLFLGRRSCPVSGRISLGVHSGELAAELKDCEWQAASWYRRQTAQDVRLDMFVDATEGSSESVVAMPDEPVSFDPRRRVHGWRNVSRTSVTKSNPDGRGVDFFAALGGA